MHAAIRWFFQNGWFLFSVEAGGGADKLLPRCLVPLRTMSDVNLSWGALAGYSLRSTEGA